MPPALLTPEGFTDSSADAIELSPSAPLALAEALAAILRRLAAGQA